jgi:hypothetical protein
VLEFEQELQQLGHQARDLCCRLLAEGFHEAAGANQRAGDHDALGRVRQAQLLDNLSGGCGAGRVDRALGGVDAEAEGSCARSRAA